MKNLSNNKKSMTTRAQKWGNSIGVRIPKEFARQAGIILDTPMNLEITEDSKLLLSPDPIKRHSLEDLLKGYKETADRLIEPIGNSKSEEKIWGNI